MSGLSWVSRRPSKTESLSRMGPRTTRASVTEEPVMVASTDGGRGADASGTVGRRVSSRSPETMAFSMDTPLPAFRASRISSAGTACAARSALVHSGLK